MKYVYSKLIIAIFLLSYFGLNAKEANGEGSQLYLMSATIAPMSPQDNGGIMGDKKIRIINLGPAVNYSGVDYAPTISADGKTLFFVSNRKGSVYNEKEGINTHDFWFLKKEDRLDTVFSAPKNLDPSNKLGTAGVNTIYNEGAASIAADGQSLYFTGCNRPDGLGSCDIYKTSIEGESWSKPINLGKNVNSKYFDSQPAISADQSRLYFISSRPGPNSNGEAEATNFDIWFSDFDFDLEEWGAAKNLEALNTKGTENSPFIGADGVTLFFASNGHKPNFGGTDFYVSKFDFKNNSWAKPENLGEPINTSEDEQFITLPASGDILYFSSRREDLDGYQGDLDVFMAFVPSFFKAVNLTGTVVDECSQLFIPAEITVKNTLTGKINEFSLTNEKQKFERIVVNEDYRKDNQEMEYVNFEITATNPAYGSTTIVQKIDNPGVTKEQTEADKASLDINVKLTLGQKPVLAAKVVDGEYVNQNRDKIPALKEFNGLVMKEVMTRDLYPLLNSVFFDEGSSTIPERYISLTKDYISSFNDTTIAGGTLDKYYHVLNIYGFRLNQHPDTKITLVGCNDNLSKSEKGNLELSKARATAVFNYLRDVWGIAESRMKIDANNFPDTKSNPKDTAMGWPENRRVEVRCDDWRIMKPVFEVDPKTFPQPVTMDFITTNGIADDLIASKRIEITRSNQPWNTINNIDANTSTINYNWKNTSNKYPIAPDNAPYTAQLIVTTKAGTECKSAPIEIPVYHATTSDRKIVTGADSTQENYSLILFPFNSAEAGPLNERIMKDYVYGRVYGTSNITVIGHTDVIGLYETNKKLSERRAGTVFDGINQVSKRKYGKLEKSGVGEDNPLYNNDLPEGRFYNRTVQVLIQTPLSEFEK